MLCNQQAAAAPIRPPGQITAHWEVSLKTMHDRRMPIGLMPSEGAWTLCRKLDVTDSSRKMVERRDQVIFDSRSISDRARFRAALVLAIVADALQIAIFPLFVEGAESPAADLVDLGVGAALAYLLGWHWEFLPSFLAKLVPGVDLVPFWTMAVANVYRKSKQPPHTIEGHSKARSNG